MSTSVTCRWVAVVSAVSLVAGSFASSSPASAESATGSVDGRARSVTARIEPGSDDTSIRRDGTITIEDERTVVVVPKSPRSKITVRDDVNGSQIALGLPMNIGLEQARVQRDGTSVFLGRDSDVTVNPTENGGVQALLNIKSGDAPTTYSFDLGLPAGAQLWPQNDGSIIVVDIDGEPFGTIGAPWAVDATGASVPTRYAIADGALVQTVDHHAANVVYPVIADPSVHTSWWGQTLKLTRSEMDKVRGAMIAGAGISQIIVLLGGPVTWAWAAAILAVGSGAMLICGNSKGVDIHRAWSGAVWCSGY